MDTFVCGCYDVCCNEKRRGQQADGDQAYCVTFRKTMQTYLLAPTRPKLVANSSKLEIFLILSMRVAKKRIKVICNWKLGDGTH